MIHGNTMEPYRCTCSNGEVFVLAAKDQAMAYQLARQQCRTGVIVAAEQVRPMDMNHAS